MSKTFSFFSTATGEFLPGYRMVPNQAALEANTPEGYEAIEGIFDPAEYHVDLERSVIVKTARRVQGPSADAMRAERDRRLAESDWVVVRAQELGEAIPAGWRAYRQALRDVTEQKGFPGSIEWPIYTP